MIRRLVSLLILICGLARAAQRPNIIVILAIGLVYTLAHAAVPVTHVYKKVADREPTLNAFNPPGWKAADRRRAIVFFHRFFNPGRGGTDEFHCQTPLETDWFFASLGWLKGKPTLRRPDK